MRHRGNGEAGKDVRASSKKPQLPSSQVNPKLQLSQRRKYEDRILSGAGNIGATAARLFVEAGHEVVISNSRGPESLRDLVSQLGGKARAVSVNDAIQFGDIVFISIPFGKYKQLPTTGFEGKVVIPVWPALVTFHATDFVLMLSRCSNHFRPNG